MDSDRCQVCAEGGASDTAVETITHFLFDCPAYQDKRHEMDNLLGQHSRDLEFLADKKRIQVLLRFVGCTQRLKKTFRELEIRLEEDV